MPPVGKSGHSARRTRTKGTSWCSNRPSTVARARRTTSVNPGSPDRSTRSRPTPWKHPMRPSTSTRRRPLKVVESITSLRPVVPARSASTAATRTTKVVLRVVRASACTAAYSAGGTWRWIDASRRLGTSGRWSKGRVGPMGTPARARFQYRTWAARRSSVSHERCHRAKSAYWTGSGRRPGPCPRCTAS